MKVALVSEGTYPYAMSGVSVWCEQLIVGMPDYTWDVVALSVDGGDRAVFSRPDNLDRIHDIPLWGPRPAGRGLHSPHRFGGWGSRRRGARRVRRDGAPGQPFLGAYEALLGTLLPGGADAGDAPARRYRFVAALRAMFEYASAGGDLIGGFTSNEALTVLVRTWNERRDAPLSPAEALEALWRIGHMLGPLAVPPVRADIVHSSMNGLSVLVGMTAKWRYGTPLVVSEHGIYLRERYMAFLEEHTADAVKVLVLAFFRLLAEATYFVSDALAPHSAYNRRWQLRGGADPAPLAPAR